MTKNYISICLIVGVFILGIILPTVSIKAQSTSVVMTPTDLIALFYQMGLLTQEQAIYALTLPGFAPVASTPITFPVSNSNVVVVPPPPSTNPVSTESITPNSPSNLNASIVNTSCTTNDVTLSWGIVSGATGYAVRFDNPSNGYSSTCSVQNAGDVCSSNVGMYNTYYTIRNVAPGKTYKWWVHALNGDKWSTQANGEVVIPAAPSSCSNTVATSTPSATPIITLGGVTPQLSCNTNTVDLAWRAVPNASSYNIRINDRNDGWLNPSQTCSNLSNPNNKEQDECVDGVASTTLRYLAYKVSAGHTYDFWVDVPNLGVSSLTRFVVPTCQ